MSFNCPLCKTPLNHKSSNIWWCPNSICDQTVAVEDVDAVQRQEGLFHKFRVFTGTKSGLRVERIEEPTSPPEEGMPEKTKGTLRSGTDSEAIYKILAEEANKALYECASYALNVSTLGDPVLNYRFLVDCPSDVCKGQWREYTLVKGSQNLYKCPECPRVAMISREGRVTDE